MKKNILVFLVFFILLSLAADSAPRSPNLSSIQRLDGSTISATEIDKTVTRLMDAAQVTGLGLAILNDGQVAYIKGYGYRNAGEQLALNEDTVMYAASFSKAAFAYMVMQLVEEGVLNLDKPISKYLPKPLPEYPRYADLANEPGYKLFTARMLLSHTSGLPNWRWFNDDKKLHIMFIPGSKYSYSGEGIDLLQLVIETITKKPLQDLMRERVFKPLGMTRTSMVWSKDFEDNFANGYDEKGLLVGHQEREYASAAGSMVTTLSDYARFLQAVMEGKGLKPETKELMLTPQIQIFSAHQFPIPSSETTEEDKPIRLSYGLGWGLFFTPNGKAYFKEGHDDGWEHYSVSFDDKKTAILIMTNSSNGEGIFKELLETLIKNTYTPWKWEGYIPYDQPHQAQ